METVPLRTYLREIDYLIQEKKTIAAFNQCIEIIKKFPKNIAALQQIGKIELDLGELEQSEFIFSEVHNVLPDDLTASIGLSCIFENRNNPEKAAYYMERAFEHQPSNKMLQDELKRIRSLRDISAHTKIKLTRGALIKLYMRSKLYPQAISEIQLGLSETPNRRDFKLELARAYFESDQMIEAFEVALELLRELPYCLDANRICFQCLSRQHDIESAQQYKYKLIDLDPYYKFFTSENQSVMEIPDIAISMDRSENSNQSLQDYDLSAYRTSTWGTISNHAQDTSSDELELSPESGFKFDSPMDIEIEPIPLPDWALETSSTQQDTINDIAQSKPEHLIPILDDPLPIDADVPIATNNLPGNSWLNIPDSIVETSPQLESDTQIIRVDPDQIPLLFNSFQEALKTNNTVNAKNLAGLLLKSKINQIEMLNTFGGILEKYPEIDELWIMYANSLFAAGESSRALTVFSKIQQRMKL